MSRTERMSMANFVALAQQRGPLRLPNSLEAALARRLESDGFVCLRGGWPDFLAVHPKTARGMAVEAKSPTDRLSLEQRLMHFGLSCFGVAVHTVYGSPPPSLPTGRQFLTSTVKSDLERRLASLEQQREALDRAMQELRREVEYSTIVIERSSAEADQPVGALTAAAEEVQSWSFPHADGREAAVGITGAMKMEVNRAVTR